VALPTGTLKVEGENAYPTSNDCLSGYYLDSDTKTCLECGVGAHTCTNVNKADSCKSGYSSKIVGGTCVKC